MALFGTKTCGICGRDFKGLGHVCKDGEYCGDCYKRVHIVIPDDDAMYMTLSSIRHKLEQNADLFTRQELKSEIESCPICGKRLKKLSRLELMDSYICMNCAEKALDLRAARGYEYLSRMRLSEISPLFDTVAVTGGKTDAAGRRYDANELRIVCPLVRTQVSDPGSEWYSYIYIDTIDDLDDAGLARAAEEARALREARRAEYGGHRAVFMVDDIKKRKRKNRQGTFYLSEHELWGRVLLGELTAGLTAVVKRREGDRSFPVASIGAFPGEEAKKSASEGLESIIVTKTDVPVYPGDVLLID